MAAKNKMKTMHVFMGFFFLLNFGMATGFLGIPYGFFYSGYLISLFTLLVIAFVCFATSNYLLEAMARAQVR